MDAAEVDRAISPIGEKRTPLPESHARELAPLVKSDPEQAREVWREVNDEQAGRSCAPIIVA
jgi:hypothetical protein